jgi:hypothetical protein
MVAHDPGMYPPAVAAAHLLKPMQERTMVVLAGKQPLPTVALWLPYSVPSVSTCENLFHLPAPEGSADSKPATTHFAR